MPESIDWDLAARTGVRLASDGPEVSLAEARDVVAQLREAAAQAVDPVAAATGLRAPEGSAVTVVVDRPAWIRSNVEGFRSVVSASLEQRGSEGRGGGRSHGSEGRGGAVGARATGAQLGAALAWMSGKVLGQYEAFRDPGEQPRLLLVAPNIRAAEEAMGLDPADFRLWVALHEETHRVQFGAVPWLSDHLRGEIDSLLSVAELRADELAARLLAGARSLRSGASVMEVVQSPEQRVIVDRLTAVMSLLEGHADYVMDNTAPDLIPSLATIRSRFDARRHSPGVVEGVVRRLLGLDAKMRQYSDGAAFVREVVAQVGMSGLNVVWTSADALPTLAEIHDPAAWVSRTAALRAAA